MPNQRTRVISVATAVAALALPGAIFVSGCGSGKGRDKGERAGEQRGEGAAQGEEAEKEQALKQIPREDSVAFYQLATTTGLLTERAAALVRGRRPPRAPELAAATSRVRALAPRDPALQRLRVRLLDMLGRPPPAGDRRAARVTLAAASKLELELARYTHAHQQFGALVPD